MLEYVKGNLLEMARAGDFDVIIHGCNCQAAMGGGLAAQIAAQYPDAQEVDLKYHLKNMEHPELQLGNFSAVNTADGFTIVNAYTQAYGGSGSFSYAALEMVLIKVNAMFPNKKIGIPYIGCGIAGGDQNKIVDMFELFAIKAGWNGSKVTLVEYGQ